MNYFLRDWRTLAVGAMAISLWLCSGRIGPRAQQKPPQQPAPAETGDAKAGEAKGKLECWGVGACSFCHESRRATQGAIVCRCTELVTWETRDKHSDAWNVLLSPRAQQMGKQLGYEEVEITIYKKVKKGDEVVVEKDQTKRVNAVAVKRECVACHGVVVDDPRYARDENEFRTATQFMKEEGINCYACHGRPDNAKWKYQHWPADVGNNAAWRAIKGKDGLTSREIKDRDHGMRDLWDPAKRAQLCFSCHIGNISEGKFVTHAMYAAGHPPLPGIEVATFSEEMPRHWEYPLEKSERARELQGFDPEQAKFERTNLTLLGGAAALRTSLGLIAAQAEQTAKLPDARERILDLALFDCYACHHELKERGWRPQRGYSGRPGRPQPQLWPTVLVRAGLVSLKRPDTDLDAALKPLRAVFDKRPFGDPAEVASKAHEASKWCDSLIAELGRSKLDAARAGAILAYLADIKPDELPDYDSARLRAWAFLMVYGETRGLGYDEIRKRRAPLEQVLKLSIPATRQQSLENDLPQALGNRNDYDPAAFKKEFRKFTSQLFAP
jgi:hypothetical protein